MKDYYQVLGLTTSANIEDVKRAYRLKASKAHPDVNPSPNAHEEFIEINEAYEFLLKEKTGFVFNDQKKQYSRAKQQDSAEDFAKEARQRATENAKKEYQEFVNSTYYKTQIAIFSVFDYGLLATIILIFGSFIAYIIFFLGISGLFIGVILGALMGTLLFRVYSNMYHPPVSDFKKATKIIFLHPVFYLCMLFIVNFLTFFQYAFDIFVPFIVIFVFYIFLPTFLSVGSVLLNKFFNKMSFITKFNNPWRKTIIWGAIPLLFSLFLWSNSQFSSNPHIETYFYQPDYESDGSFCVLKNDKYHEYSGIRFVFADPKFTESNYVTYTIEEGFWGIDVLKNYSLSTSKK